MAEEEKQAVPVSSAEQASRDELKRQLSGSAFTRGKGTDALVDDLMTKAPRDLSREQSEYDPKKYSGKSSQLREQGELMRTLRQARLGGSSRGEPAPVESEAEAEAQIPTPEPIVEVEPKIEIKRPSGPVGLLNKYPSARLGYDGKNPPVGLTDRYPSAQLGHDRKPSPPSVIERTKRDQK